MRAASGPSQAANIRVARPVLTATAMSRTWIAGALLVVMLASGCTTRRGSVKWAVGGVAMAIVGGLLLRETRGDEEAPAPAVLAGLGMVFGGAGIAVFSGIDAIFASDPVVAELPPPRVSAAEHDACLDQRRAIAKRASTIADLGKRARVLQTMPNCPASPLP
jgi:hypothetical protein